MHRPRGDQPPPKKKTSEVSSLRVTKVTRRCVVGCLSDANPTTSSWAHHASASKSAAIFRLSIITLKKKLYPQICTYLHKSICEDTCWISGSQNTSLKRGAGFRASLCTLLCKGYYFFLFFALHSLTRSGPMTMWKAPSLSLVTRSRPEIFTKPDLRIFNAFSDSDHKKGFSPAGLP